MNYEVPAGQSVDGQAALFLIAALLNSIEKPMPGAIAWIDQYLVEALSRSSFGPFEKAAIEEARSLLAGLQEGLRSSDKTEDQRR